MQAVLLSWSSRKATLHVLLEDVFGRQGVEVENAKQVIGWRVDGADA